jgi:hypothetical protein
VTTPRHRLIERRINEDGSSGGEVKVMVSGCQSGAVPVTSLEYRGCLGVAAVDRRWMTVRQGGKAAGAPPRSRVTGRRWAAPEGAVSEGAAGGGS